MNHIIRALKWSVYWIFSFQVFGTAELIGLSEDDKSANGIRKSQTREYPGKEISMKFRMGFRVLEQCCWCASGFWCVIDKIETEKKPNRQHCSRIVSSEKCSCIVRTGPGSLRSESSFWNSFINSAFKNPKPELNFTSSSKESYLQKNCIICYCCQKFPWFIAYKLCTYDGSTNYDLKLFRTLVVLLIRRVIHVFLLFIFQLILLKNIANNKKQRLWWKIIVSKM